ncbi:MAG: SRPBCC family protein [Bdellovibrionales bacterium]
MLRWLFLCLLVPAFGAESKAPFWKAKERVYSRIQNGEIIVSVKKADKPARKEYKHTVSIAGGGHVGAPYEFVYTEAMDFQDLPRVSGYIDKVNFDSKAQRLSLDVSALGHKASLVFQLRMPSVEGRRRIEFEAVSGPMKGLSGRFDLVPLGAAKTEVGIDGAYSYDEFPIHRVFLEFGLEFIFQRMAARLRSHVESEYNAAKNKGAMQKK